MEHDGIVLPREPLRLQGPRGTYPIINGVRTTWARARLYYGDQIAIGIRKPKVGATFSLEVKAL